jgi:Tfp pilus assembly protein PilV
MKRSGARGYTAVELLMSVAVFAVGISGVVALEKVTVVSNQHAKNLSIATQIAQSWVSQLNVDAARWNNPSPATTLPDDVTNGPWLGLVNGQSGVWIQPVWNVARGFGPGFDALGNPTSVAAQTQFCTNLRLIRLYPATTGGGLIRAEVRVFWLRDGQSAQSGFCNSATTAAVGQAVSTYHFVYETTAISQQTLM